MYHYKFHREARVEFLASVSFYRHEAPVGVARSFSDELSAAIETIRRQPDRWRVVAEPAIRRYVLRRFPFVIYYRVEEDVRGEFIMIYAILHCSRDPGYWRSRVP